MPAGNVGYAEVFHGCSDDLPIPGLQPLEGSEGWVTRHSNQLTHRYRKHLVHLGGLQHICDPSIVVDRDGSGGRCHQPGDAAENGRFARTVGSDDGGE